MMRDPLMPPRLSRTESLLLVVDVQTRLVPAINNGANVVTSCDWLIRVAREFDIPLLMTEQSPDAIGPTVESLREQTSEQEQFTKTHFSCVAEPGFLAKVSEVAKTQIVVCGMETHVCVMQTVLDLLSEGLNVFVVSDAVGSRFLDDRQYALERMRAAGAVLVTREMVFFELLGVADRQSFSPLLRKFITGSNGLDKIRNS